ncbi:hypothetical protein Q5Y75_21080 [Ruegeria sp. 2205SS24-7]|uniref:hypothetical protein n=1 Tax=Ruegeria discodermiae TaxID=3064389 RepID=UPI0027411526|nr:hypothetical protein [Ruegeria sp. 2205SS24-7]MDP5219722.1 hypothetical protein [Ruegeria sp. 2205SS24-7]
MAGRPVTPRVIAALLASALALSACGDGSTNTQSAAPAAGQTGDSQAEEQLAKQAAALQKTVLQGALAGGATGGAIGFGLGGSDDVGSGISIGLGAGAAAGSYVAFVQRKYIGRESRLRQIKKDLDANAVEMQTTINVMNQVLAAQKAELDALKAQSATGQISATQMQQEVTEANGNLAQMQIAIDGATKRQGEFAEARGLTVKRGESASPIDGDLAALQNQIGQMRAIANDLATAI